MDYHITVRVTVVECDRLPVLDVEVAVTVIG